MAETLSAPKPLPIARINPFDPPDVLAKLREEEPLSRLAFPDGHVGWLVTNHALARAVLADNRFSARQELRHIPMKHPLANEPRRAADPGMFIRMDPPDHTKYRRLLTGQFTVRRMRQLEPRIAEITAEHLDAMEAAGPPADLVEAFSLPIPSLVICELLGVPYTDRERFQHHTRIALNMNTTAEQSIGAFLALKEYFAELVAWKKSHQGDDLLSGLIEGGELDDQELAGVAFLLLLAGHETTANMLALGTFALLRHPDQLDALRANPSLAENAVEELLRYLSIIHIGPLRAALEDVELGGQVIKAGDSVVISTPAANRDPGKFSNADDLDLRRPATGHVAFGHGVHQCLGQQLARIEMRVGYPALLNRFPTLRLAVAPEDVPLRTDMNIYGVHKLPVAW
ncbi:cytochrome P450 [Flindersiella endophytica]